MTPVIAQIKALKTAEQSAAEFRQYLREGIALALDWWFKFRWPLRFGPRAANMFKYSRRTLAHLIRKARIRGIQMQRHGNVISFGGKPPGVDPEPFQYQPGGGLKETAEAGKSIKVLKRKPVGKLRLPFGHPIHPTKVGELDRVTRSEWKQMVQIVFGHVYGRVNGTDLGAVSVAFG